jgi:hypothetical protein
MSIFSRYIGIDYSGASTPERGLKGIRVYLARDKNIPEEQRPISSKSKYWSRRELAHWLLNTLQEGPPTLIGIDHCFSFPIKYFASHNIENDWKTFLLDFHYHWPSDAQGVSVQMIRNGTVGRGAARLGDTRWRRLTDVRAVGAKSVFHFDVPGSVAKSSHAGLPWLNKMKLVLSERIHVWPFDGWTIRAGKSVLAEVYPALWSSFYPKNKFHTQDQHDAFCVASYLAEADRSGLINNLLSPDLSPNEKKLGLIEGWILGVE